MNQPTPPVDEESTLLAESRELHGQDSADEDLADVHISPALFLPLSLLAALGIALTIPTTVFAYASLLCKDPTRCEESEQNAYAGTVALATFIANACGLLALGFLERLSGTNRRAGFGLWFTCRAMSIVMLAFGVYRKSIAVALSGRVFQGLASDNLLHFNLNSIFVRARGGRKISRFIGSSLTLYMIGISIGPIVGGLFEDFTTSFILAIAILATALLYLVYLGRFEVLQSSGIHIMNKTAMETQPRSQKADLLREVALTCISPLRPFRERPLALLPGLSLLIYNATQSYIGVALMIHTSIRWGFSSRQNGFLIAMMHLVAASYLFLTLFGLPRIVRLLSKGEIKTATTNEAHQGRSHDATFAQLSMFLQTLSLVIFAQITKAWQVYPIAALLALGLAVPSFVKSHFIKYFPAQDSPQAMAGLTFMETVGGLFSPVVLGSWQTVAPGGSVFLIVAGMISISLVFFAIGAIIRRVQ